ncbi:hypothetical protein QP175_07680 [Sphingomonas aerolata]|uniref:hypothetical protein n=1 Tax=Sphingomonas aerolata TaxID=185951 RepID=UPI002FE290FF
MLAREIAYQQACKLQREILLRGGWLGRIFPNREPTRQHGSNLATELRIYAA